MSKRPGDNGYAPGWCIHYRTPSHHKTCEADIPFDNWRGVLMDTQPCFLDENGQSKLKALPCERLRRPTAEEIAFHEEWLKGRMNRIAAVMLATAPWRKAHKGKSTNDVIQCPICKGRLHLSIAAYNGHVHGRCESADCVAWME